MGKTKRLSYILGLLAFYVQSSAAQITQSGPLSGNLDAERMFVNFIDTITYMDIQSVPDAGIFLGILGLIYYAELNIFEEAFENIDEIIHEALGSDDKRYLYNKDDNVYPTGVKGMALATAYLTTNGIWGLFGYFSALLMATLALVALIVTTYRLIPGRAGEDEDDDSSSSSSGSSGSGSGSSGGSSGGSSNWTISDVQDAGSAALGAWKAGTDYWNESKAEDAASYLKPGENLITQLRMLNHDDWRNDMADSVNQVLLELEDEEKKSKNEVKPIARRAEGLIECLEECHELREKDEQSATPLDPEFKGSELDRFLTAQYHQDQLPLQRAEKILQQLKRLLSLQETFDADFEDEMDAEMDALKELYRVTMFITLLPYDIDQMITNSNGELNDVINLVQQRGVQLDYGGVGVNATELQKQLKEFQERRGDYKNIVHRLKNVVEEEMRVKSMDMNWMLSAFEHEDPADIAGWKEVKEKYDDYRSKNVMKEAKEYEKDLEAYDQTTNTGNLMDYHSNASDLQKEVKNINSIIKALFKDTKWWKANVYESDFYKEMARLEKKLDNLK